MKVFMIGGTGLLGSAAARIFIDRGHSVKSVALPPLPEGAPIPEEMEIVMCNIYEKTDDEIKELMAGCDCFVSPQALTRESSSPHPFTTLTTSTTSLRSRDFFPSARSSVTRRPLSSALTSPTLPKSVRI